MTGPQLECGWRNMAKCGFLLALTYSLLVKIRCQDLFQLQFELARKCLQTEDQISCEPSLLLARDLSPNDFHVNGLLASIYTMDGQIPLAIKYFVLSLDHGGWSQPDYLANYIEALRLLKEYSTGEGIVETAARLHPESYHIAINGAILYLNSQKSEQAIMLLQTCLLKKGVERWLDTLERLNELGYFAEVDDLGKVAIMLFPNHPHLLFLLGLSQHYQSKLQRARELYQVSIQLRPDYTPAISNLAGVYQAMGKVNEAKSLYQSIFESSKSHAGFLNNYGSLLLLTNTKEEGVGMLRQAVAIDPTMASALLNLASYSQDEGLIDESRSLLTRAASLLANDRVIAIRLALLMDPVPESWAGLLEERRRIIANLRELSLLPVSSNPSSQILDASFDRVHFYIVYSGLNDKVIQQLTADLYTKHIWQLSKYCFPPSSSLTHPSIVMLQGQGEGQGKGGKIRVGMLSKFFGIYEPHGMLLEGAMRYLPRPLFEVIALSVAITDGKPLSPSITNHVDRVVQVSLVTDNAVREICALDLDILIFADTLSEPVTHFLSHSRMALLQMAFWGNPITSGSRQIDYFISADYMEHPYRTRLSDEEEPYVEQVVLLPGQGIWYSSPDSIDSLQAMRVMNWTGTPLQISLTRDDFDLPRDKFIFMCPQSVFKLHPLFDRVLAEILRQNPAAELVLTAGRRQSWTNTFLTRLEKSLEPFIERVSVITRVSSEKFLALIRLADVVLHPFPFDGSRTSADSIAVGVPFITLPSDSLRGRMGASLLRTMNLPELVATNVSHYIDIARRLHVDRAFYVQIRAKISERSKYIWNDVEDPFHWTQFLSVSSGIPPPSWNEFLEANHLDVDEETHLASVRRTNRRLFDESRGQERWLLSSEGLPSLPALIKPRQVLPIFADWRRGVIDQAMTRELDCSVTSAHLDIREAALAGV
jgi:protein O-GlcNAc transferase